MHEIHLMKLAYHTYAFGGRSWLPAWTLEEALRLTAELGFQGLELAACRPHGWPADLGQERRRALRRLAADWGLAFSAICPTAVNHNLASPVPEERQDTVAYIVQCMDLALDLGTSTVIVNGGWTVQPYRREEARRWAIQGLASLAARAEARGAVLALENINSARADVVVTTRDVADVVSEVGSPSLRPMLDLYHLYLEGEEPVEAIEHLGRCPAYVHFSDAKQAGRARVAPGLGELPWTRILSALRSAGYDGWLAYEIWGDDPVVLGRQAMSFLIGQLIAVNGGP